MLANQDQALKFHKSIDDLLDIFRNVIVSMTWLKASTDSAITFYENYPYIIDLSCSVSAQAIKVDKSILKLIKDEGFGGKALLYSQSLGNFYRVFTIAVKDIIWSEPDFKPFLQKTELQFLKHLRNASAHNNKFFWGNSRERINTIENLPISWRGKIIEEKLEGSELFFEFIKPGDIFLLLADISSLIK